MMRNAARGAIVVIAIACAIWLGSARYAIGLDYEGGAQILVRRGHAGDVARVEQLVDRGDVRAYGDTIAIDIADGDDSDVAAMEKRLASIAPPLAVESSTVIAPISAPWRGRPLAVAVALAAALGWLAAIALRRAAIAAIATFALAWALALVDVLRVGGTLSRATHAEGIALGVAAAIVVVTAARRTELRARFVAAWPGAIVLGALVVASVIAYAAHASVSPDHAGWQPYVVALRLAHHAAPAVIAACALAIFALPIRATS